MFVNLLPKSANLLKQDYPRSSSHRAIILGKSVRFIPFFHILAILLFLGKLKRSS